MKQFDITIVEVLVHRASIEAPDLVAANEVLAREMWDEEGPGGVLDRVPRPHRPHRLR